MKKPRPIQVIYKTIKLDDSLSFQEILESLDNLTPTERTQRVGNKDYILNNISKYQGMYYAEIICSEAGKIQSIVHKVNKNNNLIEREITTEDVATNDEELKGSSSDFVSSRIIFGLSGNHLVVSFSTLGERKFIDYFNFLFKTYYWKNDSDFKIFYLKDVYVKSLKEKLKTTNVDSIVIGQGVMSELAHNHSSKKPFGLAKNSFFAKIRELVSKGGDPLALEKSLDDANLRVKIQIDYQRTTTDFGQQLLDDITISLAALDYDQLKINFADGSDLSGGEIRTKTHINQHFPDGKGFDRLQLQKDLHAFLQQHIE